MGRLDGKVALVTGAARGIGAAEAELFAKEGAQVVITDILVELAEELAKQINNNGGNATAFKHDVSLEKDWQDVIEKTIETYGKLDILVNNAGTCEYKTLEEATLEDWNKTMNVNAASVFLGMKYVIPEMKKVGGGSIVNTSSVTGLSGIGFPVYNASKGAIRAITKNVAVEYAKDKIRVNTLHPGVVQTVLAEPLLAVEEARKELEAVTPLPYLGEPKDIAYCALYLASDESKYVTGAEYLIDGGLMAF